LGQRRHSTLGDCHADNCDCLFFVGPSFLFTPPLNGPTAATFAIAFTQSEDILQLFANSKLRHTRGAKERFGLIFQIANLKMLNETQG